MKEMVKAKILTRKSVNSVMNERELLSILRHPFIINMISAFQDSDNLYLILDYLNGGDLRYKLLLQKNYERFHINKKKKFSEDQTKFFVACIIVALEYLHNNNILHRDIKPENLVFDEYGYLRLTDFGIARYLKSQNFHETSGTPGYMAPEVMNKQNHGIAADYYALGVIVYECMLGKRPYNGKTRNDINKAINQYQVQILTQEIPLGWTLTAADFVNRLIQREPSQRLGYNGPEEVKYHQ